MQPRPDESRLEQLKQIGEHLRRSLELASKSGPGTLGRRAAWDGAERATAEHGEFVKSGVEFEAVVRATAAKLARR